MHEFLDRVKFINTPICDIAAEFKRIRNPKRLDHLLDGQ